MSNKRRYTRLRRAGRSVMLAVGCVFFATTCAPNNGTTTPITRLNAPPVVSSAGPALGSARKTSAEADIEAERARAALANALQNAAGAVSGMQAAVVEAQRLSRQKSATENELLALYNRMVEQEKRMTVLVNDITDAEVALVAERNLRAQVTAKLVEAEALVAQKDAEGAELRRLLAHSEDVTAAYAKAADTASRTLVKLQGEVGVEKGKVRILFYICLGLGAVLLLIAGFTFFRKSILPI